MLFSEIQKFVIRRFSFSFQCGFHPFDKERRMKPLMTTNLRSKSTAGKEVRQPKRDQLPIAFFRSIFRFAANCDSGMAGH
jgi:hypothetical protein